MEDSPFLPVDSVASSGKLLQKSMEVWHMAEGRTQIMIALVGLAGVLGAAVIANWDKIHGTSKVQDATSTVLRQSAASENKPVACTISGVVFDSDSNKPLSAVAVDVHHDASRPPQLRANLATTGPDGKFTFDCGWIDASQYPIVMAFRHSDWLTTMITGPRIKNAGRWENLNIPISMNHMDVKPFQQVSVSYSSKQDGTNWFVVGEVLNTSDQPIPCVLANFSMSTPDQPNVGILTVEFQNLAPHEKRPYERQLPRRTGFYLESKSECH
jgi:hypothetical protein